VSFDVEGRREAEDRRRGAAKRATEGIMPGERRRRKRERRRGGGGEGDGLRSRESRGGSPFRVWGKSPSFVFVFPLLQFCKAACCWLGAKG